MSEEDEGSSRRHRRNSDNGDEEQRDKEEIERQQQQQKLEVGEGERSVGGSLFVSNLSRNVTSDHLKEIFGYYGFVKSVELKYDRKNRLSRGQATISFQTEKDAEHAMFYLDGGQVDGNIVKVSFVLVEQDHRRTESPEKQPRELEERDRNRLEEPEPSARRDLDRKNNNLGAVASLPSNAQAESAKYDSKGKSARREDRLPANNHGNNARDNRGLAVPPSSSSVRREENTDAQRGRSRSNVIRGRVVNPPHRSSNSNINTNYGARGAGGVGIRRSRSRDRRGEPISTAQIRRDNASAPNRARSRSRSARRLNGLQYSRDQRAPADNNRNRGFERRNSRERNPPVRRRRSPSLSSSRSPSYRRHGRNRSRSRSSSRSRSRSSASSHYRRRRRSSSSSRRSSPSRSSTSTRSSSSSSVSRSTRSSRSEPSEPQKGKVVNEMPVQREESAPSSSEQQSEEKRD